MIQRTYRSCVPTAGYTSQRVTTDAVTFDTTDAVTFDTTDAVTFDTTDAQIVRPYKGLHVNEGYTSR
ncbi:hypothetical protein [uncultured Porphyromonas sp.]|uniref:hypothetical protein n=1 Tax=uncultured Porphyromonas sp. TaxID=159274 RepID=UPI002619D9DD|nr:hypothetical protein [uncultured Porphyromonas sp.]